MSNRTMRWAARLGVLLALSTSTLGAQTSYYNLDGSRPLRVEDALPTERYALDAEFAPFRFEHYANGTARWRAEPKLSYGILPLTELEVRVPVIAVASSRRATARGKSGVAGIAVGALRAFGVETGAHPALALGGEVLFPVGPLAGPRASYTVKGLLTRTRSFGRVELNAAYGTYSVRTTPASPTAVACQPTDLNCPGVKLPFPFDFPCAPPMNDTPIPIASRCAPSGATLSG